MIDYKNILFFPLYFTLLYLLLSIILLFFGPIEYVIHKPLNLSLYLIIIISSFSIGFRKAIRSSLNSFEIHFNNIDSISRAISGLLIVSTIYTIIYYLLLINHYDNIGNFKLTNPALGYFTKLEEIEIEPSNILRILTYFHGISLFYFPISLIYWKQILGLHKILFFIAICVLILYYLNIGTLKGIGDLVIQAVPIFFIRSCFRNKNINIRRLAKKFILLLLAFLLIFTFIQISRIEYLNKEYEINLGTFQKQPDFKKFNTNENSFSKNFYFGIEGISNYIAHGYVGLSYSLSLPFEWTYGIGFSRALSEIVEKYFDIDIRDKTYLQRNEDINNWPNGMYWSTVIPWFASDITFPGVIILFFYVGKLFANRWISFFRTTSIISLVIICQLFVFVIYIPANNQLFQSRQALFNMILLIIMAVIEKRKVFTEINRSSENNLCY